MPVGFRKSYWHHQMNCLIMDLGKSRFVEPYLGTFMDALSCVAGQDTPVTFPRNSLSLFLFGSKALASAKYFFECSFYSIQAIKGCVHVCVCA